MTVPVKPWTQLVSDQIATWGAGVGVTPVLSEGDFLLAIFEAVAGQMDFLQAQNQIVLNLTRAATSTGDDLDSWMADFSFPRLAATFATGPVVLSKLQPSQSPILVSAAVLIGGVYVGGVLVQTQGGAIVYQVIPDTTEPTYDSNSNSYILPAGASSMTATVQAVVAGTLGNVAAGAISQLASQSPVDTVNNIVPLGNGFNAESDADYRSRFVLYLGTLAKATGAAILAAAKSVQQGVQVSLLENTTPQGTTQLGAFTAFISNGAAGVSSALLASIYSAVYATRAFTVTPYVTAAIPQNVTIALAVHIAAGFSIVTVQPLVQSAVITVVDSLAAGETLYVSEVMEAALSVSGVVAVQPSVMLNGVSADITPSPFIELQTTLSLVSVGQY